MKLIIKFWIIALCIAGIIFIALLTHEAVHIAQSKAPISICYDFQQRTWMHVLHNTSKICSQSYYVNSSACKEEFNAFENYTEKWAWIIQYLILILLGVLLGMIIKEIGDNK
jgi:hypothetical protein